MSFQLEPLASSPAPLPAGSGPRRRGRPSMCLTQEQMASRRRAQLLEAKKRQRDREASLGDVVVTIKLTQAESALLKELCGRQRGPVEGFNRRALLRGAVFLANAGNPRGKKVVGNADAAAISGRIADVSSVNRGDGK